MSLRTAQEELLSILSDALELAEKDKPPAVGHDLEKTLENWQRLGVCSFATAFGIRNRNLAGAPFNGLAEGLHDLRSTFDELAMAPTPGLGHWPWDILRQEQRALKHGLFPAVLRKLQAGALPPLDQLATNCRTEAFGLAEQNEAKIAELSWLWYAEYLALLGDKIRNDLRHDGKTTANLIYILGTRREFAQREIDHRDLDYGLIVGLTETVTGALLPLAKDVIWAAWSTLVVAQYVARDSERIALLRAARDMSHTFKTWVGSRTIPDLRNKLIDHASCKDAATEIVGKVQLLTQLSGLVARGRLDELKEDSEGHGSRMQPWVRAEDCETTAYDVVEHLRSQLEAADKRPGLDRPIALQIDTGSRPSVWTTFPRKFYLDAMLEELLSNARRHGSTSDGSPPNAWVRFEILQQKEKDDSIRDDLIITLENERPTPEKADGAPRQRGGGVDAVEAIAGALGGKTACGPKINDANRYLSKVIFDVSLWKKVGELAAKKDGGHQRSTVADSPDLAPEDQKMDPLSHVGFRVLLLDDQLGMIKEAYRSLKALGGWGWYIRELPGGEGRDRWKFSCLGNTALNLEVVLCPSVFWARDFLLGGDTHFDICLVDLDFSQDRGAGERAIPQLAGPFLALALGRSGKTYAQLFTAVGDDLRRNVADFAYLSELCGKQRVGFTIDDDDAARSGGAASKDICGRLKDAFLRWCKTTAYGLGPTPDSLMAVGEALQRDNGPVGDLEFFLERDAVVSAPIRGALFSALLGDKEIRADAAAGLLANLCGHYLSKRAFAEVAHRHPELAVCGKLDDKRMQESFDRLLPSLCAHFSVKAECGHRGQCAIPDVCAVRHTLSKAKGVDLLKKHVRVRLVRDLGFSAANGEDAYLYGLWLDPAGKFDEISTALTGVLGEDLTFEDRCSAGGEDQDPINATRRQVFIWGSRPETPPVAVVGAHGGSAAQLRAAIRQIVHSADLVTKSEQARLVGPSEGRVGASDFPKSAAADGKLVLVLNLYQPTGPDLADVP